MSGEGGTTEQTNVVRQVAMDIIPPVAVDFFDNG